MDSGFEERRKKHEDKWALDEQLRFRANARRNKLLGRWAADQLGLAGQAADQYTQAVVSEGLRPGGDNKVAEKVIADLQAAGRPAEEVLRKLADFTAEAMQQIQNGVS